MALDAIAASVARLALLGPPPDELERARTLLRARWARRLESMEGRASALAAAEAIDEYGFLDREFEALAAPFGNVRFCPTGGIGPGNAAEWLAFEPVLCIGGSWVAPRGPVDRQSVELLAREAAALRR